VDGINLSIHQGETLGIVGESGSGKSMTAMSILRLIDSPGRIVGGQILFEGKDLLHYSKKEMREIRGNKISMIFQEPMASLNPLFRVSSQIEEAIRLHQHLFRKKAREKVIEMLRLVGIPSPEERANNFPHQFSGGMQQRIMIAMALACNPTLLIADEPTTALDVTIQAQILYIINQLKKKIGTAVLYITHDLGVISKISQNVAVMYAGKIVEYSNVYDLFDNPIHPYTEALLESIPKGSNSDLGNKRLNVIPGNVPNLIHLPPGCSFSPRCKDRMEICNQEEPVNLQIKSGRYVRCWKYSHA
jgi:peptide/nickel transport system ATP-binding protein/oligopeptide transport system ATP-binding protein